MLKDEGRFPGAPHRATVVAEEPVDGSRHDIEIERDIAVGIARAEAEVFAAESCVAMVESRVRALAGTVARLRALALQVGLLRPQPITEPQPPPPVDDLTVARARKMLARGGFARNS